MYRLRYVGVALVAGTVGAMVALMLAPDSGANTRKKIRRAVERERTRMMKRSRQVLDDAGEYLEERVDDGRRAVRDMTDEVAAQVTKGRRKVARMVGA